MRLLNRHIPTLLFVLILALGTTGAFALGAHDENAVDGPTTADTAQTQGDVDADEVPDLDDVPADDNADDGLEIADEAVTSEDRGCGFAFRIVALAGVELPPEAEAALENCENGDNGEDVGTLDNGEDTSERAQHLGDEDAAETGEEFGRDTAGTASDGESEAGDEQDEGREEHEGTGSDNADDAAEDNTERRGR